MEQVVKECPACDIKSEPTAPKRKQPEQEAATSTTPSETPTSNTAEPSVSNLSKIPTSEWGIEEVIRFIESTDPCLGIHADLFRKHVSTHN